MKCKICTLFYLLFLTTNPDYLFAQGIPEKIPADTTKIGVDTSKINLPKELNSIAEAIKSYMPRIIPPSPDAAALGRYGEIPVDYSRGSAAVTIPIYEVQSGSLRLPVSLSYHSGGVRVNDQASSVGLSWSLNAGGALTRSVNGLPDEKSQGFFNIPIPKETTSFNSFMCYIGKVAAYDGTTFDGQQDSYFYNFNGNSGRFVYANKRYANDDYLSQRAAVTIPYKPIKIEGTTFTAENGEVYQFGEPGAVETTYHSGDISYNYTSTWYLSRMVSANKMDTIRFEYTTPVNIGSPILWSTSLTKKLTQNNVTSYSYSRGGASNSTMTIYLSNIYFKNGKVGFVYSSDRQDITSARRLTNIIVYKKETSGIYTELKRFDLTHTYFNGQDTNTQADAGYSPQGSHAGSPLLKRLKLTAVTERIAGGSKAHPSTQLTYYEDHQLPIYGSYAQDFWGFFNGATANQNLLIKDNSGGNSEPTTANGANRSPSLSHGVTGSLKEIIYPTGGKTRFEYESHILNNVGGGGIRIKSVSDFEGSTLLTKKIFSYPAGYITNSISTVNMDGLAYQFTLNQEEFDGSCLPVNTWYTTFPENYNFMLGSNSGSSMAYTMVEESLVNSSNASIGKTVRTYTQSEDLTSSMFPFASVSNEWRRGHLLEEKQYNSSDQIVKQVNHYYRTVMTDSVMRGYGARATYIPLQGQFSTPLGGVCTFATTSYCSPSDPASSTSHAWSYQALDHPVGSVFTDSTVTITFSENGTNGVREKLAFTYGTSTHHQVKSKTLTNSKNQSWQTFYKYPHEMATGGNVYQEMVNRHIYTPVIEEENKINTVFTRLIRTNYQHWYPATAYGSVSGFLAPYSVEQKSGSGPWVTHLVYGEKLVSPAEPGYDPKARPVVYTTLDGNVNRLTWWDQQGMQDLLNTASVNGQTTVYDHHGLTGVKSVTDPNSKTLYYEYDEFNRLKNIRNTDASGSIRTAFCYNYASQTATPCTALAPTGSIASYSLGLIAPLAPPLPVTLISFEAKSAESAAVLQWNTTQETGFDRFDIERSPDGRNWTRLGSIPGKDQTENHYTFTDDSPLAGENLYRLKMADKDDTYTYSPVRSLVFGQHPTVLYPNPVTIDSRLRLMTPDAGQIGNVQLFDTQGRLLMEAAATELDTRSLAPGLYIVQITYTDGSISTHRIIKN